MSITSIIRPLLLPRARRVARWATQAEETQAAVLERLLARAAHSEWGLRYEYGRLTGYEQFARAVPLTTYDTLKTDIDRMRHGEPDVLWPGRVKWFAKSSGTTNDKSKFIPVSPDDAPNYNLPHSQVGDLSAILIEHINPLVNLVRVPAKRTALLADFEVKRDRIARETAHCRVTNLSGVPSWMLSVLHRVLETTGRERVTDVWPHLEVFFHGGVAFTPYREEYRRLIPSEGMHYMETYNASEGFFGIQSDPADPALLLMLDYGVFYEFIPLEELESDKPQAVPLWGVAPGRNYAMVISTSCGLWRYLIGDTVKFTSVAPYKFIISGRTKSFINAFGEELIVDNAERALATVCARTGAEVEEYTAAPVFMDQQGKCRHQWVIEFRRTPPSLTEFARLLDEALQQLNSDYEAKRYKDITLQQLEVVPARRGLFADWLRCQGKLGGQHKVPRLSNTRDIIEQVLALNSLTV